MLTLNKNRLLAALLLFLIEVSIALWVHDRFIRPFLGDVLAVILLYCLVKAFLKASVIKVAAAVLLFSCSIEALQYFKLVKTLGLRRGGVLAIVIGSTFDWADILAYTVGIGAVLLTEHFFNKHEP